MHSQHIAEMYLVVVWKRMAVGNVAWQCSHHTGKIPSLSGVAQEYMIVTQSFRSKSEQIYSLVSSVTLKIFSNLTYLASCYMLGVRNKCI